MAGGGGAVPASFPVNKWRRRQVPPQMLSRRGGRLVAELTRGVGGGGGASVRLSESAPAPGGGGGGGEAGGRLILVRQV